MGGLVIGPLYDSYGARPIVIPGTLIYVLAFMFTSLATKRYQFILAQGVMFGIGNSML
jgi:nitrate/nitrite transporter NarK